ncbi:hypothetical protein SEA_SHARKBOY_7 [Microbacterium phage Sharkboy]|uniref:Uncharacterized protein n=2 Tax=Dismasvirus dismas TaxID=2560588 RepID=A0A516KU86_9CAUD|nr:hypothetical protein FDJ24_gp07 [Microbacterium phage Dismas]AUG84804.1 hypothetical protein PBI_DISMAS_7 [Microbacterium phage Dismas]QDP45243.1 hypothetical protein SEA_SHARKBOY_7 [Microbacterium phage Sharkboy]
MALGGPTSRRTSMTLQEYEIEDPDFGSRTFQWDKDRDGVVGFPKGAKLVKRGDVSVDETADGADPADVVDSQEPDKVLDKSADGQPSQADVDAAKQAEGAEADKAKAAPANK